MSSISGGECGLPDMMDKVLGVLRSIRINVVFEEYELQEMIARIFENSGIAFKKEYKLAARNRIDFLVEGGIGIEVKKGKPNRTQVCRQLERYAAFDEINCVILIVERSVNIPCKVNGKQCVLFGLNRLWGVALR